MAEAHSEQSIPTWCPIVKVETALNAMATDLALVKQTVNSIEREAAETKRQTRQDAAEIRTQLKADASEAKAALNGTVLKVGVLWNDRTIWTWFVRAAAAANLGLLGWLAFVK